MDNRRPLKTRSKPWAQWLARFLAARKVQPNHISIAGIGFAVVGGGCFLALGWVQNIALFVVAGLCVQARLLCNMMDGLVAVEGGLKSNYGDLFNEIPDRIEDGIFLVCAGHAAHEPELGWLCAALAVFTAYVRAFGGSLGQAQDFCGPMAKPHRMFVLTLGCVMGVVNLVIGGADHSLNIALWVIALGAVATSVRRILRIAKSTLSEK